MTLSAILLASALVIWLPVMIDRVSDNLAKRDDINLPG